MQDRYLQSGLFITIVSSPENNNLVFNYSIWASVNCSDTFSNRINVLELLKLKLIVLVFMQHSSQSQKMVFIRLSTIKDTSGMNLRIPPVFGQNLSI